MYSLAIKRDFIAQHYLTGGDWGVENQLHSHHYVVEVHVEGNSLDQHGYLVDIVNLEMHVDKIVTIYRGKTLNSMPEFEGLNPSLEHFARIFCEGLSGHIRAENLTLINVQMWENEIAWAAYRVEF